VFSSIFVLQGIPKDTRHANEKQERWLSSGAVKVFTQKYFMYNKRFKKLNAFCLSLKYHSIN